MHFGKIADMKWISKKQNPTSQFEKRGLILKPLVTPCLEINSFKHDTLSHGKLSEIKRKSQQELKIRIESNYQYY